MIKGWLLRRRRTSLGIEQMLNRAVGQAPPALDSQQWANQFAHLVLASYLRDRRADRFWRGVKTFGWLAIGVSGVVMALWSRAPTSWLDWSLKGGLSDNVGVVRIEGAIEADGEASAAKLLPALERAFGDSSVRTVALYIDSPGGAAGEAERVFNGLERLKSKHNKPVVAVISNIGASAAYLIALHADRIVAGRYSMVGSIGAKLTAWDVHRAANTLGVTPRTWASGELKNMLDPFLPPSPAADRKAQALVDEIGAVFLAELRARRAGKLKPDVDYASGEVWTGAGAQAVGLIDDLGTLDTAFGEQVVLREYGPSRQRSPFGAEAKQWIGELLNIEGHHYLGRLALR